MEKYLETVRGANRYFDVADHMIYVTYPLVNDTKIILTIIENLYNALVQGIDALICHNYLYKKVSYYPKDIEGKIEMFKTLAAKYGFDRNVVILLKDLKSLVEHRNNSPMEFSRSGSHVLADRNFGLKMVGFGKAKKSGQEVRGFIEKLNKYFEYDRRIRR